MSNLPQPITPSMLRNMLGYKVTLREYRRNRRLKVVEESVSEVIILNIINIYSSVNVIVEFRSVNPEETFIRRSVVLNPEGLSVMDPNSVVKSNIIFTNE